MLLSRILFVVLGSWSTRKLIDQLHSDGDLHIGDLPAQSKLHGSRLRLRETARRLRDALSHNDVNLQAFVTASNDFVDRVERMGDFTSRGVQDARQNLQRVEQASRGRLSSMRQLLSDELNNGARLPQGGPASRSAAEALLWARLGLSMWVEIFKERCRTKASLPAATRQGFARSLGRYLDRFSRTAFNMATRATPDWDVVRERTHIGCEGGVCSDATLDRELRSFVRDVEPVLERMTEIQKSVGLEDPRTP